METKSMGQGMMAIAIAIGIALMTLYFSGMEERRFNPNKNPESLVHADAARTVEVPLMRNRYGHYVVTGEINGREVDFLLDTGATDVVVPEDVANAIGLAKGRRGQAMTANGPVTIWDTHIHTLTIGGIKLHDINASINPRMTGAILLGMSALGQVEFTQSGNTLTLKQKSL